MQGAYHNATRNTGQARREQRAMRWDMWWSSAHDNLVPLTHWGLPSLCAHFATGRIIDRRYFSTQAKMGMSW